MPQTSERYRRCSCPIYVEGSLGGETVRKALDQTSWEAASELIASWTASGKIGVVRADIPSITDAVKKFFEDAAARQLQPATISKQKNLLEKRLVPWCEQKGFRHLQQLDVDALRQFRTTWPALRLQEPRTPPVVSDLLPAGRLGRKESGEGAQAPEAA